MKNDAYRLIKYNKKCKWVILKVQLSCPTFDIGAKNWADDRIMLIRLIALVLGNFTYRYAFTQN